MSAGAKGGPPRPAGKGKAREPLIFFDPVSYEAALSQKQLLELRKALAAFKAECGLQFDEEAVFPQIEAASRMLAAGLAMTRPGRFKAARKWLLQVCEKVAALVFELEEIEREPFAPLILTGRFREQLGLEGKTPGEVALVLRQLAWDLSRAAAGLRKGRPGPELKGALFVAHLERLVAIFEQTAPGQKVSTYNAVWLDFASKLTSVVEPLTESAAAKHTSVMLRQKKACTPRTSHK